MTQTLEPQPDLAAIKQRQQQAWASGDFHVVAARIVLTAEQLCDTADLHAGWRVLDVATGSGNAAIAAARLGCEAVGVDYVPALLDRGRRRAAAEWLDVEFLEGDAEALPFPDASFDAVTSVFGCMFAPDHAQAASELLRVCRPGGTIALASWTPDGFIGQLFRTIGTHVPPPGRCAVADALGHGGRTCASSSARASPRSRSRSGPSRSASRRPRSSRASSGRGTGRR